MGRESLLKDLTISDLPEQYRQIADVIGLKELLALSEHFGGTQRYIPMAYDLTRIFIERKILEEFDGGNWQKLAVKYGVSQSTARRILNDEFKKHRQAPLDGQLSLLEGG